MNLRHSFAVMLCKPAIALITGLFLAYCIGCRSVPLHKSYINEHGEPDLIYEQAGDCARFYNLGDAEVQKWHWPKSTITLYYLAEDRKVVFEDGQRTIFKIADGKEREQAIQLKEDLTRSSSIPRNNFLVRIPQNTHYISPFLFPALVFIAALFGLASRVQENFSLANAYFIAVATMISGLSPTAFVLGGALFVLRDKARTDQRIIFGLSVFLGLTFSVLGYFFGRAMYF